MLVNSATFSPRGPYYVHGNVVSPSNYSVVILVLRVPEPRGFWPTHVGPSVASGGVDAISLSPVNPPVDPLPSRNFEIADANGVVRVVLGLIGSGSDEMPEIYGLSLRGADGAERVALSIDEQGPTLVFVRGGNIAIQLGVDDPFLPGDHTGAFITLANDQGTPLLQVSVADDGSLQIRSVQEPPSEST